MSKTVELEEVCETLKAMAHPIRLQMLIGLVKDECNVGKIQKKLGLPQSTVSQHLAILRRNGLVQARREGVKVCYRVSDPRVRGLVETLLRDSE